MRAQGEITADPPVQRQQSPVEIENRLAALETSLKNLPDMTEISRQVTENTTTVKNLPDVGAIKDQATENTAAIKTSKWWISLLVGLSASTGIALGALVRAFGSFIP